MSDFEVVLERLLADPAFAAALAADPAAALAGYELDPDEVALLHTQVGADPGGQHDVEVRANQSSLFGMLSPLTGLAGALPGFFEPGGGAGGPGAGAGGAAGFGGAAGMGPAGAGVAGMGPADDGIAGIGPRTEPIQGIGPRTEPIQGMGQGGQAAGAAGAMPDGLTEPLSMSTGPVGSGLAGVLAGSEPGLGPADSPPVPVVPPPAPEPAVPDGYRTRVDIDGDGRWDRHELHGRADGGVDIVVDRDGDGRPEFVGHDLDADGLVDISEYDRDGDGVFERRMYDDDGDGWMDRSVEH
nr:Os1348 family NHLP clan protein [Micromonospora sp. DSM 115978]